MALKDNWQDLQDAVAGDPNSGSDITVEPINKIANAVIALEGKSEDNPDITIDNSMDENSTNPVQNNVIFLFVNDMAEQTLETANKYTDEKIKNVNVTIDVDTEMSDTSENAVQNKIIKAYVDAAIETAVGDIDTVLENIIAKYGLEGVE